jgi:glutamate-1-semialdehyde 2,1-aminomutase
MKIVAIVQARLGSTRLPNKVLAPIGSTPLIEYLLGRLSKSKQVSEIVLATSTSKINDQLAAVVKYLGYQVIRGSENDVLQRYVDAATATNADVVIRITGDCPFVDPQLIDEMLEDFIASNIDYMSNTNPPTFPDGFDIEIFKASALLRSAEIATSLFEREHVTPCLRTNPLFTRSNKTAGVDSSHLRLTVDEQRDLDVIRGIASHFSPRTDFSLSEILGVITTNPHLITGNLGIERNEGATMNSGQKLWKRAQHVIPGGNMLLSKRPDQFLPEHWPAYFSKARGCTVLDLDDNALTDMSIMGIGTNSLGYGHPEVDAAVAQTVRDGNMSTLNCPEEVYLAERLVAMHPWAEMARFARTGGEANAIAIRIARAATGKSKVAICGYHGWHDWYLAANLGTENTLAGHLLPGLEPNGVPENLRGSVLTFNYNRIDELEALISTNELGAIMMEVSRNFGPEDNFLQKVRDLATKHGIVLMFDECTSGFRQTFGGLHKLFGVEPDMAMFGKALGNGYAITAVLGKRSVMEAAQNTFISSTFWTERIGPTAALATLDVMEQTKSWEIITKMGQYITEQWNSIAKSTGIAIKTSGLPALTSFSVDSKYALEYKTLITQEMLKKSYLAGTSVYVATVHTKEIVDRFFAELEPVFALIKECEDGRDVNALLDGPTCSSGFKRLN